MKGDNILLSMEAFGQHFAVEEMFNGKANRVLIFTPSSCEQTI